jgi:hypothetical protein
MKTPAAYTRPQALSAHCLSHLLTLHMAVVHCVTMNVMHHSMATAAQAEVMLTTTAASTAPTQVDPSTLQALVMRTPRWFAGLAITATTHSQVAATQDIGGKLIGLW